MGVYIKGMEMPKDCTECKIKYFDKFCYPHCGITKLLIAYSRTKSDCPLTEVPEPHGRLIDADKLTPDEVAVDEMTFLAVEWDEIKAAPTVIDKEVD